MKTRIAAELSCGLNWAQGQNLEFWTATDLSVVTVMPVRTTTQGTPVRFSVSGNAVTSISITYNFSPTCTGTLNYMRLAADIRARRFSSCTATR